MKLIVANQKPLCISGVLFQSGIIEGGSTDLRCLIFNLVMPVIFQTPLFPTFRVQAVPERFFLFSRVLSE